MSLAEERPEISVVIPVYRAEDCIDELYERLIGALEPLVQRFEILLVEDGGEDGAWDRIAALARQDPRVVGLQFSRNFGQHHAITAGLDRSCGDWVTIMDCDLQDRPEEIPRLWAEAQRGFDIVLAKRRRRQDTVRRRFYSSVFYAVFNYLTGVKLDKEVAGFCILSRKVVESIASMREASRFLMAFVQWVGFPVSKIEVQHDPRYSGETTYTFRKMFRLALNASVAFSNKPLEFAVKLGFLLSGSSILWAIYVYTLAAMHKVQVPGWASLTVSVFFIGGLILAELGILGIYLGKVYEQTKQRPLYIIRRTTQDSDTDTPALGKPHERRPTA